LSGTIDIFHEINWSHFTERCWYPWSCTAQAHVGLRLASAAERSSLGVRCTCGGNPPFLS